MNLLITSAGSELAKTLTQGLADRHDLRLTDRRAFPLDGEFAIANLGHDASTDLLVRGIDAVVLVGEPHADDSAEEYLDGMTRGTYNLLMAASQEGVKRVVYLSTLDLMTAYGPEYNVTERWRPRPSPEPRLLGKYLGESVCREFARERKVQVVVLRLGTLVAEDDASSLPLGVTSSDVVAAVEQALVAETRPWSVFHVQSEFPGARFDVGDAKRILDFRPTVLAQKGGGA